MLMPTSGGGGGSAALLPPSLQINLHFGTGFLAGIAAASISLLLGNAALFHIVRKELHARDINMNTIINRRIIIDFLAGILSDIMEHPAVDAALSHTIARGVNRWMSSKEAQEAIRAMVMQTPREEAVREFGKEVPGYVLHFAGGFMDSITGNNNNNKNKKKEKDNNEEEKDKDNNNKTVKEEEEQQAMPLENKKKDISFLVEADKTTTATTTTTTPTTTTKQ